MLEDFGGKVRTIFDKYTQIIDEKEMTADILSTIRSVDFSLALKTLGGNRIGDATYVGVLFALKSAKLPEQCEDGTWRNRIVRGDLFWASEFIETCICKELLKSEREKLKVFLEVGTTVPVAQSLLSRVFQNMVHQYIYAKATC